jgi:hypothetical protein
MLGRVADIAVHLHKNDGERNITVKWKLKN